MSKHLPLVLIISSGVLIFITLLTAEQYDKGFWIRVLSSVFLIFAMVLVMVARPKNK